MGRAKIMAGMSEEKEKKDKSGRYLGALRQE
jgi:hypothetical protein